MVPADGDFGRSGTYPVSGVPQNAAVAWRASIEVSVQVAPVLVGGLLIVGDQTGVLYAFDAATGEVRWRHEHDSESIFVPLAVWKDWVFVSTDGIGVHDLRTGEVVRRIDKGGVPTVFGDTLLVHGLNQDLRAFNLPGLEIVWTRMHADPFSGWIDASPAITPEGTGYAAIGLEGNRSNTGVTAFDLATGDVVFALGADEATCPVDEDAEDEVLFGTVHPVAAEGMVWIPIDRVHEEGCGEVNDEPWVGAEVVGLDPGTGEQRWIHRPNAEQQSKCIGAVAVADGIVYFAVFSGAGPDGEYQLHAVDVDGAEMRWTALLPERPVGSAVIAGGTVYTATSTGTVGAFDASTGQSRWSVDLGERIAEDYEEDDYGIYEEDGQAVIPADGMLYVRTSAGIVALH